MAADVKCNDKAGAVIARSQSQDSYGTRSLYAHFMQRASPALMCAQGIFACVHSRATGRHMGAGGAVDIIEELDHRGTRPITRRQASHINPPHADASNPLSLRQSAPSLPFPRCSVLSRSSLTAVSHVVRQQAFCHAGPHSDAAGFICCCSKGGPS